MKYKYGEFSQNQIS
jgi:hypothetical protein